MSPMRDEREAGASTTASRDSEGEIQLTEAEGSTPSARTTPFSLGNRPALTGVRALLMVPVVAYHAGATALQGSWMPLEFFFVLSGFLITAMLASEQQRNGRISLSKFYSRRGVRLLPPLVMTVGLLAVYAALVSVPDASE